jgi:putative DNA primase/helicase
MSGEPCSVLPGIVEPVLTMARSPKPLPPEPVDPRSIPALAPFTGPENVRWIGWRYEYDAAKDKWTKVPKRLSGDNASSTEPATWTTFEQVWRVADRFDGIGIMLLGLPGLAAIDLDKVLDPQTGEIVPWARDLVAECDSYTEVTPSGAGLRILGRAATIDHLHRNGKHPSGRGSFELYVDCERYITVTGQANGSADRFADITAPVNRLLALLDRRAEPVAPNIGDRPAITLEDLSGWVRDLVEAGKSDGKAVEHPGKECFTVAQHLRRAGYSEAQVLDLASRYSGGVFGKYGRRLPKEIGRMWGKIADTDDDPPWQIKAGEPYATAKRLRELRYGADGLPTLHHHRGGFFAWNGSAYPEIDAGEVRARAYEFLDECVVRVKDEDTGEWKQTPVKPNTNMVNNLLDALRAASLLSATIAPPTWLEPRTGLEPRDIIACANGLLHLPTLDLLPHMPAFFTHNALDYNFERNAPEPAAWLAFLGQLWPDDTESIAALQEMFGYVLGADTDQEKAFLIVGPKRSGKGTIARVLTGLVGAENRVAPTLAELGTNFGLAPLIGKRVAIISDARLGGRADQAAIAERLLSITGEDALTIDRKYREAWTGRLGVRFLIFTNELPRLNDASGALASRFIVLVLTESFYGREDRGLTNKLLAELPGILNWAIKGWQRLRERGHFLQPETARDAINMLEDLGSPTGAFLRDACELGTGRTVSVDAIYDAWEEWCEGQGQKPGTKAIFGKELHAAFPGLKMSFPHEGAERIRTYVGVGLKTKPVPPAQDGAVKWYDPVRGYGFVTLTDGSDAMLSKRVVEKSAIDSLTEGQPVKVSVEETERGLRVTWIDLCDRPAQGEEEIPF